MLNIEREFLHFQDSGKIDDLDSHATIMSFAEKLEEDLGIKCKAYDEGLYVFNYSQIDSPKTHSIVIECRGLIVDRWFNVVCKPFNRFFNIGEAPDITAKMDLSTSVCYEKADGSFIKVFFWDNLWHVATRGTAFAESENYTGVTFEKLVFDAFGVEDKVGFSNKMDKVNPKRDRSYFFEYTSPLNRVVTPYTEDFMVLLGDSTEDCWTKWDQWDKVVDTFNAVDLKCRAAKYYHFQSEEDMRKSVSELPSLEEGYVCLDYVNRVRVKVKSPAYLSAHRLRDSNGTPSPKNICGMVVSNEYDEYLAYFPEERQLFDLYIDSYTKFLVELEAQYNQIKGIEEQKDFAMSIKNKKWSWFFFQARRHNKTPKEIFNLGTKEKDKVDTLLDFHNTGKV